MKSCSTVCEILPQQLHVCVTDRLPWLPLQIAAICSVMCATTSLGIAVAVAWAAAKAWAAVVLLCCYAFYVVMVVLGYVMFSLLGWRRPKVGLFTAVTEAGWHRSLLYRIASTACCTVFRPHLPVDSSNRMAYEGLPCVFILRTEQASWHTLTT